MAFNNYQNNGGATYNPLANLNDARRDRTIRDAYVSGGKEKSTVTVAYKDVLTWVQNNISSSDIYTRTLKDLLESESEMAGNQLKNIITKLLQQHNPPLPSELIEHFNKRIYEDMAGFGIITDYLADPNVEEINVYGPGPKQIEVITKQGAMMLDEGFTDAQTVLDIAKRMVRRGGMTIDMSNPRVDSYIGGGTRVSAMISPVVREDKGAYLSIRKQTESRIGRENLVASGTATAEELRFVELITRNNVSGAIVGATGSGKTTILNYLMTDYVETSTIQTRVYIIEESRELQLPQTARAFYTAVCGDEKAGTMVTAPDLLKSALRFHPTFICCAEMRGEEAMNAMTAAQTGHEVWSTLHADNCEEAYQRILTMCKMSGTDLSENLLMRNIVSAFPIMISAQQMKDGTRKITGIYEAEDVDGIQVVGHYIYKFDVLKFQYDDNGKVQKVHGIHKRKGDLSDRMAQRIFDNCGRLEDVLPFAREGWRPDGFEGDTSAHEKVRAAVQHLNEQCCDIPESLATAAEELAGYPEEPIGDTPPKPRQVQPNTADWLRF